VTVHVVAGVAGATEVVVQVLGVTPDEVTVYLVMVAPPLETGAVQETTDWALAFDVAVTVVGALGTVDGVAAAEAADEGPVKLTALVAVTVNV